MSTTIQRRVEALEFANDKTKNVGIVIALEGETTEQALARLGLKDDDSRQWIVVVPMKGIGRDKQ
jgi:hypothetical protein